RAGARAPTPTEGAVSDDESAIRTLIARFANAFDLKAWDALDACLTESLHTDYSDLRGTPPETVSRQRFVELRRAALDHLATHHVLWSDGDWAIHSGIQKV